MTHNFTAMGLWVDSMSPHVSRARDDDSVSWNAVFRLVMLSLVATGGSMGNVFIMSSITVMEPLQVKGNIYLVSLAMANLLVTALALPASCIAILAGIPHEPGVCPFQWLTTVMCFLVSVLSFMFMAVENHLGLGGLVTYDLCCTKARILFTVFAVWAISSGFAIGQHVMNYGPSFCKAPSVTWPQYHMTVGAMLVVFPVLVTVLFFGRAVFRLKNFKLQVENLEDPTAYVLTDEHLLRSNIIVFILMLFMWAPCAVVAVISVVRPVTSNLKETSWWVALANSCVYSYVYAATNKDFREAFNKLFYYCCCKSHVTFSRRQRDPRRSGDGIGLRVHIIPGLNIYAQRKETIKESRNYNTKASSNSCNL